MSSVGKMNARECVDELELQADGFSLSTEKLRALARNLKMRITYRPEILERVSASRKLLEEFVDRGRVIYGVNTSMGGFVSWLVPIEHARELQENLISAVATNVGAFLPDEVVRAAMAARINSLSRGMSAISVKNFEKLVAIFNAGVLPCIPEKGSLGASGDLGPLATIALVCIGRWKAKYEGKIMDGGEALRLSGIEPMVLSFKEGLAMINGTSAMAGLAAIVVEDAINLVRTYDLISCLSFEALHSAKKPFDPRVHRQKPHRGQLVTAENIFRILEDSRMAVDEEDIEKHLSVRMAKAPMNMDRQIEDAYSVRCTPQIMGPVRDCIRGVKQTVENELNSSNDNPLVIPEHHEVFHNGHFHGQYVSMAMDQMAVALTTLSNLSERRIDRFMDKGNSNSLPAFLCRENPGLRLGLMGGQFMATSVTAENRSLCTPVSIQTLTSTGDFQDIVSMGLVASRRAKTILENTCYIIAFELLCACQGADIRGSEKLGKATRVVYDLVRERVPYLSKDVCLTEHIEALVHLIDSRRLVEEVEEKACAVGL